MPVAREKEAQANPHPAHAHMPPRRDRFLFSSLSHSRRAFSKLREVRTTVLLSRVLELYWVCRKVNNSAITFSPASSSATALSDRACPNCAANEATALNWLRRVWK